ncbi:hypothetical protein KQH65_12490 [archaeon]|nr:hypothetical protein [archaeon]
MSFWSSVLKVTLAGNCYPVNSDDDKRVGDNAIKRGSLPCSLLNQLWKWLPG